MTSPIPEPDVGVGPWQGDRPTDPRYDPELLEHGDRRNVVDRYRYWRVDAIVADLDTRRHPFHVAVENWQHDLNIGSVVRTANAFNAAAVHIVGRRRWNRRGAMVTDRYQHVLHHPDVSALLTWVSSHGGRSVAPGAARRSVGVPTSGLGSGVSMAHPRDGLTSHPHDSALVAHSRDGASMVHPRDGLPEVGTSAGRLLVVGVDNLPGAVPIEGYELPRECVLLFGQEGPGLSRAARDGCDVVLSIAQFGSTRSINAGAAAAIAMHTWVRQHAV